MEEIWKDIPDYENLYEISNKGAVWCKKKGHHKRIGLGKPNKYDYKKVVLVKDDVYKQYPIHRLVAITFLDKNNFKYHTDEDPTKIDLNKLVVNHKDENKHNNCVDNLEWCTPRYNRAYSSYRNKTKKVVQYDLKHNIVGTWKSVKQASIELNLCKKYIYDCCTKKRKTYANSVWEYVE